MWIMQTLTLTDTVMLNANTVNPRINARSQLDAESRIDPGGLDQLYK